MVLVTAGKGRVDLRSLLRKRAVRLALILLILVPLMYVAADLATASAVRWRSNVQGDLTLKVNPTNTTNSWDFTAIRFNISQLEVQGGPVSISIVETDNGATVLTYDGVTNTTLNGIVYPDVAASFALPGRYFSISVNGGGNTATVSFHIETYIAEDVTPGSQPSPIWNYVWMVGNTITLVFIVTFAVEFTRIYTSGLAVGAPSRLWSPLIPCILLAIVAASLPFEFVVFKIGNYSGQYWLALTWVWVGGMIYTGPLFSMDLLWWLNAYVGLAPVVVLTGLYVLFFIQFVRYWYKDIPLVKVLAPLLVSNIFLLAWAAPAWYYTFFEYRYSPGHQPPIPPDPFGNGPLVLPVPTFAVLVGAWLICLYVRRRIRTQKTVANSMVGNTKPTSMQSPGT